MDLAQITSSEQARRRNRNNALRKRRNGLVKKASELATLCDVDVCLICYGQGNGELTTWPQDRPSVERSIRNYFEAKRTGRVRQNMAPKDFLREEIKAIEEGSSSELRQELPLATISTSQLQGEAQPAPISSSKLGQPGQELPLTIISISKLPDPPFTLILGSERHEEPLPVVPDNQWPPVLDMCSDASLRGLLSHLEDKLAMANHKMAMFGTRLLPKSSAKRKEPGVVELNTANQNGTLSSPTSNSDDTEEDHSSGSSIVKRLFL